MSKQKVAQVLNEIIGEHELDVVAVDESKDMAGQSGKEFAA